MYVNSSTNISKLVMISLAVFIIVSILPTTVSAAPGGKPSWQVGNWWEYSTYTTQNERGSVVSNYFCNETSYFNITGTTSVTINSTNYNCFVAGSKIAMFSQAYSTSSTVFTNMTYNYVYYYTTSNDSIVKYTFSFIEISNSIFNAGGHNITRFYENGTGEYYTPCDNMQYPIYLNKIWNATYNVHSYGDYVSKTDNYPASANTYNSWSNTTSQMWCDNIEYVSVPAGTFNSCRLNCTYYSTSSVTYTFTYYSQDAGNTAKYTSDMAGSGTGYTFVSSTLENLVAYSYTPIPVIEIAAGLLTGITIFAIIIILKRYF